MSLGIKAGNLLEICRCPGCGTEHACGEETCKHSFGFAIEDEADNQVKSRLFLIGDIQVPVNTIVAYAWAGWIPEEIEFLMRSG